MATPDTGIDPALRRTTMQDVVQALKQIFVFKHVSEPVLRLVADVAEPVTFGGGEILASETEPAKTLILIRTGTVRCSREGMPTVDFGSGQTVGLVTLLDGGPVGITAVALERVDAYSIRLERLHTKLAGNTDAGYQFYHAVARSLAMRLRLLVDELELASEFNVRR
jgi:CRP-like cAMP-binding protein